MYQSLIEMIKQPIFWSIITFVIVLASFLAMITDLFKRKSPIEVGFLFNGSINSNLRISTGDPAKKVYFRFKNTSKIALTIACIVENSCIFQHFLKNFYCFLCFLFIYNLDGEACMHNYIISLFCINKRYVCFSYNPSIINNCFPSFYFHHFPWNS